jgi:hypothetical protein
VVKATSEVNALPRHQINSHRVHHEAHAVDLRETWGPHVNMQKMNSTYSTESYHPTLSEEG